MGLSYLKKVIVIGAGNMGGAIALGMVRSGLLSSSDVTVTARTPGTLAGISAECPGIGVSLDNAQAVRGADLIVLAVKPWQAEEVISQISASADFSKAALVSTVAGITVGQLVAMLGKEPAKPVFRIIPNTAISIMKSVTFITANAVADPLKSDIDALFRAMGDVVWVDENMLDSGMALASCGIAYALKYIDAAMRGGEDLGFSREEALLTVLGTVEGALSLLRSNSSLPQDEIDKVTTPGGYTFRGLQAMEQGGFSASVRSGLLSCRETPNGGMTKTE